MRGVDLRRFEFDYDLTWAGFFLDPRGQVLGRFGGRDATSPDTYLTLDGLKHAMATQLAAVKTGIRGDVLPKSTDDGFTHPDDYPSAARRPTNACIHCHEVYHFRQDWHRERGTWSKERVWVFPPPDNLGMSLDPKRQDRVASIRADSPAQRAGLQPGDTLIELNGRRIASFADAQYALHRAPATGRIPVRWKRDAKEQRGEIELPPNWRETDISWRESMWHLVPKAAVYGVDLDPEEKQRLGLDAKRLAFRQGEFVSPAARDAGVRPGDIIIGINGKSLEMTMAQFNAWVRLNFKVGDRVTLDLLRDRQRLTLPLTLPRTAE